MATRRFVDAPQYVRCTADIQLKDGTWAQCGRYGYQEYMANPAVNQRLCEQHANMKLTGRLRKAPRTDGEA